MYLIGLYKFEKNLQEDSWFIFSLLDNNPAVFFNNHSLKKKERFQWQPIVEKRCVRNLKPPERLFKKDMLSSFT